MENVNYFDIVVLALILMLGLKGLFRGLIKESFALMGIVVGVYVASNNALKVGTLISSNLIPIESDNGITLIGFVVVLVCIWIIAYILGVILSKIFSASGLGIFDRILGFIFGASKVFFIFSIIIFAVSQMQIINTKLEQMTQNSIMYPLLKQAGTLIINIDPQEVKSNIDKNLDTVIQQSKDTIKSVISEQNSTH
jgi:membrane protein required for colicin V production